MSRILLTLLFLITSIPLLAQPGNVAIGRISLTNGEVYIRTNSNWQKLTSNDKIYNSDKIVAADGRVELILNDGVLLRMSNGSSIHIFKNQVDGKSLANIANPVGYQVNVTLGDISFFSLAGKEGQENNGNIPLIIKTPSFKGSFDKVIGTVSVKPGGDTKLGISGQPLGMVLSGNFTRDDRLNQISRNDVLLNDRKINQNIRNNPSISVPIEAVRANDENRHAELWAKITTEAYKKQFKDYIDKQSGKNMRKAAEALIKQAQARYNYAFANIKSSIASMNDSQFEAEILGVKEKKLIAAGFVESGKYLEEIASFSGIIKNISSDIDFDSEQLAFVRASSAAMVAENAMVLAASARIRSIMMEAQVAENTTGRNVINGYYLRSKQASDRFTRVISLSQKSLLGLSNALEQQISKRGQVFSAQSILNSATLATSCSSALSSKSQSTISGISSGHDEIQSCQLSDTGLLAAENVTRAILAGDEIEIYISLQKTFEILKVLNPQDMLYVAISNQVAQGRGSENVAYSDRGREYQDNNVGIILYFDLPIEPADLNSVSTSQ